MNSLSLFSPATAIMISLCYFLLFNVIQFVIHSLLSHWHHTNQSHSIDALILIHTIYLTALFFIITSALLIYLMTKCTKVTAQFFDLKKPTPRGLMHGLSLLILICIINTCMGHLFDYSPSSFFDQFFNHGHDIKLIIALVVVAPIYEELIFRGVIYGAFVHTHATATSNDTTHILTHHQWAGLLISSILFTSVHLQYHWIGLVMIFCLAMLFAYVRAKYGLCLTILLHGLNNAFAILHHVLFHG